MGTTQQPPTISRSHCLHCISVPVKLELLSFSLSESQVDFQVDSERERRRSRRRCRRRTIRVHVNGVSLSSSSSTSFSSPFARWEDLFVNTARRVADRALRDAEVGMLAQRAGEGEGGRERGDFLPPRGLRNLSARLSAV